MEGARRRPRPSRVPTYGPGGEPNEKVTLIPGCAECDAPWLPTDHERARVPSEGTISISRPTSSSTARTALNGSSAAERQAPYAAGSYRSRSVRSTENPN